MEFLLSSITLKFVDEARSLFDVSACPNPGAYLIPDAGERATFWKPRLSLMAKSSKSIYVRLGPEDDCFFLLVTSYMTIYMCSMLVRLHVCVGMRFAFIN